MATTSSAPDVIRNGLDAADRASRDEIQALQLQRLLRKSFDSD